MSHTNHSAICVFYVYNNVFNMIRCNHHDNTYTMTDSIVKLNFILRKNYTHKFQTTT